MQPYDHYTDLAPAAAHAEVVTHLDAGGDPRAHDNHALRWACRSGNIAIVERLIALGLTADDARADNNHALRWACGNGHLAVVERLIELGLTADDARADDNNALRWAYHNGHHAVAARLLELGVEPTPYALVQLSQPDDADEEWPQRLWRAVERWEYSHELAVAESKLTPAQHEAWVTAKGQACPSRLCFAD